MLIRFNNVRENLYEVNLDLPWSYNELIKDLNNETWHPDQAAYGQDSFASRYHLEWNDLKSPSTRQLNNYFHDRDFKKTLIALCYSDPAFARDWPITPEVMSDITLVYGSFNKDLPGFSAIRHLDNRMLVMTGMVYFIDGDQIDQSTSFYTSATSDDEFRVTTGFGLGWAACNNHNTWHSGGNNSTNIRYSIAFGIRLRDDWLRNLGSNQGPTD